MSLARVKPWMVAVALAVVGGLGATGVYYAAHRQHRQDREAVIAWERATWPSITDARNSILSFELSLASGVRPAGLNGSFERALDALKGAPTPAILEDVAAHYVRAVGQAIDASHASNDASALQLVRRARADLKGSDALLVALQCRARLPDCALLPR
ncbi:MAG: hypothetical protein LC663_04375 [Actinobacteria bacterium]|nr:hypothetical protein [Actinomycetota bacterium]